MTRAADRVRAMFETAETKQLDRNGEIRRRVADGETKTSLAREFGIIYQSTCQDRLQIALSRCVGLLDDADRSGITRPTYRFLSA